LNLELNRKEVEDEDARFRSTIFRKELAGNTLNFKLQTLNFKLKKKPRKSEAQVFGAEAIN